MTSIPANRAEGIAQSVKKLLLTSAMVAGFGVYAVVQHFMAPPDLPPAASRTSGTAAPSAAPTQAGAGSLPAPTGASNSAAPAATATRAPAGATATRAPARPTATPTAAPAQTSGAFKDGEYTGSVTNAYFGNVQVKAVIRGGQLADVQFIDYPHDRRTSQRINDYAMPYLQSEAIQAQSAQVQIISGATLTSRAYIGSLQSALAKAKS